MTKKNDEPKDMSFVLKRDMKPLSWMLNSRNTASNSLLYYDSKTKSNRALRYAVNQPTPFEDEQDGTAIIKPIIFEDGALFVPKENPVLQEFLMLHPKFNKSYEILDNSVNAQLELEKMYASDDAAAIARHLSVEKLEFIARVALSLNPDLMSISEVKRDVIRYSKQNPSGFMTFMNDAGAELDDIVTTCFNEGLLKTRANDTQVWFNLGTETPSKMMNVTGKAEMISEISEYLKTDAGIPIMQMLEKRVSEV